MEIDNKNNYKLIQELRKKLSEVNRRLEMLEVKAGISKIPLSIQGMYKAEITKIIESTKEVITPVVK